MIIKNPPGPHLFSLACLYLQSKAAPLELMKRLSKKYGGIVRFQFRGKPDYLLTDPSLIKKVLLAPEETMARSTPPAMKQFLGNGLLTSQGQFHKTQRKMLQPAFHRQQIEKMTAAMSQCAEAHIAGWQDGQTVDIGQEMKHLTLDIVLLTLFGTGLAREKKEMCDAVDAIQEAKNKNDIPVLDALLNKLPLPRNQRLKKASDFLDEIIYRLMEEKRRQPQAGTDFISMLLELQQSGAGENMFTDRQIRDEAVTMLAAGHETVSNAMTWTWYLLSQHPDEEQKLYEECAAILRGRAPALKDLEKLRFTRMVYQESMRLYPPVWILGRRPTADFQLDSFTIPKGAFIHISPYLVHHDARFHKDPEIFRPERWEDTAQSGERNFTYFPFGGGTRLCIGEGFAWSEGIIIIASLAQRFRLVLEPGPPIEKDLSITLRPKQNIRMTLKKRNFSEAI